VTRLRRSGEKSVSGKATHLPVIQLHATLHVAQERCVRVSPHTAQAFQKPVAGPSPRCCSKTFAIRRYSRRACFFFAGLPIERVPAKRRGGCTKPWKKKSPRLSFAFPPANDSPTSLATKNPSDVGPLSSRVTFKPVSVPLQYGVRFFQHPKPAPP